MNFNFIATNEFNRDNFNDVEKFVGAYPDFQVVPLNDESELKMLLDTMGIVEVSMHELPMGDFSKYWDLSASKLPEFGDEQFDEFYENWIRRSQRENNMDEYGNLIFLSGLSSKWNKLNHRFIIGE